MMLEFLWDVGYLVLGFATAHTADLNVGFAGISCTPYIEGFTLTFAAFIWNLDGVILHGG